MGVQKLIYLVKMERPANHFARNILVENHLALFLIDLDNLGGSVGNFLLVDRPASPERIKKDFRVL